MFEVKKNLYKACKKQLPFSDDQKQTNTSRVNIEYQYILITKSQKNTKMYIEFFFSNMAETAVLSLLSS